MISLTRGVVAIALVATLVPSLAGAKSPKRHKAHVAQRARPFTPNAAENPYSPDAAPGAAVRALARRNQNAPGVTNELAPDNIATATGGPSGGVPGFSGR